MIEWVEELRAGFTAEFGTGPKVVTLATVDLAGRPRVRSVVCRLLHESGMLVIASDARSGKNSNLRHQAFAEACAWLARPRRQFRLFGRAYIVDAVGEDAAPGTGAAEGATSELGRLRVRTSQNGREQIWAEMSDSARALFFWPQPGGPLVDDAAAFPQAVRTGLPPPNFELIVLTPLEVDVLELGHHPHRRRLWRHEQGEWRGENLNP